MCYQLLATKSLKTETMKVYDALKEGDLKKARYAVSMVVGRDTDVLDEIGVTQGSEWRLLRKIHPTGSLRRCCL